MKTVTAPEITESQFQKQVKDAALMFGWLYYHTFRSQWSPAGFPDCVMVRSNRIVYAELKKNDKKACWPTEEQREWLWRLAEADAEVYLWTPAHIEQVVAVLR